MHQLAFVSVKNADEDLLVTENGQLHSFLYQAFGSLLARDVSLVPVRNCSEICDFLFEGGH